MLTGPEEIIFPRAQPQGEMFIENSMKGPMLIESKQPPTHYELERLSL